MSWRHVNNAVIVWLTVITLTVCGADDNTLEVFMIPGASQIVQVSPKNSVHVKVTLSEISSSKRAAVFQVHVHTQNVTLSLQNSTAYDVTLTGKNIGMISKIKPGQRETSWFVFSKYRQNILIQTSVLDHTDPTPGGCNEEFKFEISPILHIEYDSSKTTTMFQWGNHGDGGSCENYTSPMTYELYVLYLKENDFSENTYFNGLKKMLSSRDIVHNGRKLSEFVNSKKTLHSKFKIESYTGQGAIYNIIVKDRVNNKVTMAAYVPITTYSCDILKKDNSCHPVGIAGKLVATIGGVIGLFLVFLGHRFFKTATFCMSLLGFGLVAYIVLTVLASPTVLVSLVVSAVCGVILGLLWLLLWWYKEINALTVLLTGMVFGYLISSIIFYTPMGNLEYWSRTFNYGMAFTVGVMIVPVFLLYFTKYLNIVSCAFVGSYLSVLSVDLWLQTGLHMIVLNSLRHATNTAFITDKIIVSGPFLWPDILLGCVWGILFIGGTVFQILHNKGARDFPPGRSVRQTHLPWRQQVEEERQPLLPENRPPLYGDRLSINSSDQRGVSQPQ